MHLRLIFQMLRDFHLILFVLFLVLIDVVFISVWISHDPLKLEEIVFEDEVGLQPSFRNLTTHFNADIHADIQSFQQFLPPQHNIDYCSNQCFDQHFVMGEGGYCSTYHCCSHKKVIRGLYIVIKNSLTIPEEINQPCHFILVA
jgi:hypothetical protein